MGIILLASLLEAVYYFKLVGFMFVKNDTKEILTITKSQKIILGFLAIILIVVGTFPFVVSNFLLESAGVLLDNHSFVTMLIG